jgi:hypothetical protein
MVTISPVARVFHCAEQAAWEAKGCFGFHAYTSCPNCRVIPEGYAAWGENGHQQATFTDRAHMVYWVARKARERWPMKAGGMMGYRFQVGSTIHYQGGPLTPEALAYYGHK